MSKPSDSILLEYVNTNGLNLVEDIMTKKRSIFMPYMFHTQALKNDFKYLDIPIKVTDTMTVEKVAQPPLTATQINDLEKTFKQLHMMHWDKEMLKTTQRIIEEDDITFDPPPEACDACRGRGVYNNEVCWHCEGEKIDPTK